MLFVNPTYLELKSVGARVFDCPQPAMNSKEKTDIDFRDPNNVYITNKVYQTTIDCPEPVMNSKEKTDIDFRDPNNVYITLSSKDNKVYQATIDSQKLMNEEVMNRIRILLK